MFKLLSSFTETPNEDPTDMFSSNLQDYESGLIVEHNLNRLAPHKEGDVIDIVCLLFSRFPEKL